MIDLSPACLQRTWEELQPRNMVWAGLKSLMKCEEGEELKRRQREYYRKLNEKNV